jgi:protein gp37
MADKSGIQWTDATWNPVTGCSKVSAGCKNCYAERDWARLSKNRKSPYFGREFTDVRCHPERLDRPLRWRDPRKIFVNSMSDLFHESVPDDFLDRAFAVAAIAQRHTYQVLTKRPDRMRSYLEALKGERLIECANQNVYGGKHEPGAYNLGSIDHLSRKYRAVYLQDKTAYWRMGMPPLRNVWLGVSVEDQATADERIPILLQIPAALRFLSVEPLLEPITVEQYFPHKWESDDGGWNDSTAVNFRRSYGWDPAVGIDWVIAGGESGHAARPCNIEWVRSVVAQCKAARVPCFVKQLGTNVMQGGLLEGERWRPLDLRDSHGGDPAEWPADLHVREFPGQLHCPGKGAHGWANDPLPICGNERIHPPHDFPGYVHAR